MSVGMQLASAGADGVVKIWNIRDKECVSTLDNHEDRVWALAINRLESRILSGSSDSKITVWKDVTSETNSALEKQAADKIVKSQDLDLFLKRKDYRSAIILGMQLDQPFKILNILLKVFQQQLSADDEESELKSQIAEIETLFISLNREDLLKLLLYVRDWNTNAKYAYISQRVLSIVLKGYSPNTLLSLPKIKQLIDSLGSYTSRHYEHCDELLKQSYLVGFTLECMDLVEQ